MEWFEERAMDQFVYEVKLWKRYVDDTMVIISDSLLEDFTQHINQIHPSIQFTREEEIDGQIAMLDANIKKDSEGKLSFSVYRKKTHTDQYLQFSSNQPLQHKLGVIRTLHHRAMTICSTEEEKLKEIEHLQKVLSISGYTKSAWRIATKPKPPTVPRDPSLTKKKGSITLPYVGHVTNAIARVIRKSGVAVHLKPYNTIRGLLVYPKDKVRPEEKSGVVYKIECADCEAKYVGETERSLKKRITEHHRDSSPVGHHMGYQKHSFTTDNVSVVHQESTWFKRGVAEAIHITLEDPSLNRDRGRHTLPAIYREVLQSRDPTPHRVSRTAPVSSL